jgi:Proto-chlorophyllide reductase 57 kD subunit
MKFLCISCDEGMKLETASGPHDGSLEATFVCPHCHYRVAMLTNPWETQLVQTLGVKVGGRAAPATPYEHVLGKLVQEEGEGTGPDGDEPNSPGCPFAGMLGQAEQTASSPNILWSDAAKVRIERIPGFIRPMVQRAIERYALEQGCHLITDGLMDEARSKLGM